MLMSLLVPAPALAQGGAELSPDPAVNQYVEIVPTSKGPQRAGDDRKEDPSPLPPGVARRVEQRGGDDAEELAAIATAPALGAPGRERNAEREAVTREPATPRTRGDEEASTLGSALRATTEDGSGLSLLLIAGMVLTAAIVGGAAVSRRRAAAG